MDEIFWPAAHRPEGADLYEVNVGRSDASPEQVWAWLIQPDRWPSYYDNASEIRHLSGTWPKLQLGTRFGWTTFGTPVETVVDEFEPYRRLAWTGRGRLGARGRHAWLLTPDGSGTAIRTEETQRGLVIRAGRARFAPAMRREHQRWVDGLALSAARNVATIVPAQTGGGADR